MEGGRLEDWEGWKGGGLEGEMEDRERQEIRRNTQKYAETPYQYAEIPKQIPQAKTLAPTLINFDDDVLLFDGDWEGVSDVGSFFAFGVGCVDVFAAFDLDFVFSDTALCRVPPRLSGFDVEFPAVPGASEDLAFAGVVIGAWRWRL